MVYSKSRVDRAGQTIAELLRGARESKPIPEGQPSEALEAIEIVEWWRSEHARPLSRVAANLRYYAADQGKPVVAQRLKKFPTIAGKLLREPSMKLSRMGDIGGVRAILPDQGAVYKVAQRLRKNWTITWLRDYIAEPKDDGYRALHLINRNKGRLIEVQLRTPLQDGWANLVEAEARLVAPGLKFGAGPHELGDYYVALGELCASVDQKLPINTALIARVRELRGQADTFKREATDEPR